MKKITMTKRDRTQQFTLEEMMYIPDPTEIMDIQMERQMELIDSEGKYPCCNCGKKELADEMFCVSPDPSSPLICSECLEEQLKLRG